jgi:hypothetical protein
MRRTPMSEWRDHLKPAPEVQEKIRPGRVPEVGAQFCYYCRTGRRAAGGLYCTCSNKNCPYPIGRSNEEDKVTGRG